MKFLWNKLTMLKSMKRIQKYISRIQKIKKSTRFKSHNGYSMWMALMCFVLILQISSWLSIYIVQSVDTMQADTQSKIDLCCIYQAKKMIQKNNIARRCHFPESQMELYSDQDILSYSVHFEDKQTYIECTYTKEGKHIQMKVYYDADGVAGIDIDSV